MSIDLKSLISRNESVIWNGAPDRKCFILESIFNPMLFFAIIWAVVDFTFIAQIIQSAMPSPEEDVASPGISTFLPYIFFFAIHLMPVWIYLGGIISALVTHKMYNYAFTDQAVYIVRGGMTDSMLRIAYKDIEYIDYRRGVFDKLLGVGDIVFHTHHNMYATRSGKRREPPMFADVRDFDWVYRRVVSVMQQTKFDSNVDESDKTW